MTLMTVAKKATPKKPVKKAAAPRAVKAAGAVALAAPPAAPPKEIIVEGHEIAVKMPTAEQLMAWQATLEAIAALQVTAGEFEKVRTQIDRFYRIAAGLFVHDADREWLEEARLDGLVSLEKESVLGMVTAVVEAYKDELANAGNRADRRAAARKKA